jgi:hypothetical protein
MPSYSHSKNNKSDSVSSIPSPLRNEAEHEIKGSCGPMGGVAGSSSSRAHKPGGGGGGAVLGLFAALSAHLHVGAPPAPRDALEERMMDALAAAHREMKAGLKPKLLDLYTLGPMMGTGRFARVHAAKSRADGREYAVKVLAKEAARRVAKKQAQSALGLRPQGNGGVWGCGRRCVHPVPRPVSAERGML